MRFAVAIGGAAVAIGLAAAPAAAQVVDYGCEGNRCWTFAPVAGSEIDGSEGSTDSYVASGAPGIPGVIDEVIAWGEVSTGENNSVNQTAFAPVGAFGGVVQSLNADSDGEHTEAGGGVAQFNLIYEAGGAALVVIDPNHVEASGGAGAREPLGEAWVANVAKLVPECVSDEATFSSFYGPTAPLDGLGALARTGRCGTGVEPKP